MDYAIEGSNSELSEELISLFDKGLKNDATFAEAVNEETTLQRVVQYEEEQKIMARIQVIQKEFFANQVKSSEDPKTKNFQAKLFQ